MSRRSARPRDLHRNAPRPVPLVISAAFHVLLAFAMLWTWSVPETIERELPKEQQETPHETKIIWYHLQTLPEVSSEQGTETNRRPDAVQPSKTVLISQPKVVEPAPQIIRQPEDALPLLRVPVPNMIAIKRGPPTLPDLPEQPLPLFARRPNIPIALDLTKPEPKEFVPPKLESNAKKAPATPTMVAVPDAPVIAPGGSNGTNDVNALVLSLLPGRGVPPPGHAEASAGPPGNGQPGQSQGQGIKIAGMTVRPEPKEVKPEAEPKPYVATSVAPLQNTLSAPLPASSRTIPRSIEARFHGKVVYTVVVPMRKVPGYAEDWIIWFTPHQAADGVTSAAQMRPPLPIRRFLVRNGDEPVFPQGRVQIFAVIDKLGKLDSITVGSGAAGAASDAVIADLKSWEFVPALRNREAVDVDVMVELSYNSRSGSTGTMGTPER